MKRLMIVYTELHKEIQCHDIIEDEKGFVAYAEPKENFLTDQCEHPFEKVISAGKHHNCTKCGMDI